MSTASVKYYTDLLIMQYRDKTKARGTIEAYVTETMIDDLQIELANCFDLETAVGNQLDTIGKYVGVTRKGKTFTRSIILDDDNFRQLIKIGIAKNASKSSLYDIQELLDLFFPDTLMVFDHKNMSIGYFFDSSIGSEDLAEMFIVNGLLPKPMGVQLNALIYNTPINKFFGMGSYVTGVSPNNSPFNTYTSYPDPSPEADFTFSSGTISAYVGTDTEIVIPETIGGVAVTEIGANVFDGAGLTSVILPPSLTTLGSYCFRDNSLTSIVIPDLVTAIPSYCFNGNSLLTTVRIGASVASLGPASFTNSPIVKWTLPEDCMVPTIGMGTNGNIGFWFDGTEGVYEYTTDWARTGTTPLPPPMTPPESPWLNNTYAIYGV